jgi:hypothetical protein
MLNVPRLHLRATVNFMNALIYARGGQLPFGLFDATAFSEEEAEAVQLEVNAERLVQELLAETRRGN